MTDTVARKKILPRLIGPAILIAIIIAVWASGIGDQITLANIQSHGTQLREAIAERPVMSTLSFVAAYTVMIVTCLPLASLMSLLGGFLFGTVMGGALNMIGATTGSAILFLVARSSAGGFLRDQAKGIYAKVADQMEENAISYLLFMRLVPVFPAVITAVVPALFRIRLRTFIWTATVGMAPGAFIYALLGEKLGDVRHISDLFSPGLAAAMCALGLLALSPILIKKVKAGKA